jgi:hypothetical protein
MLDNIWSWLLNGVLWLIQVLIMPLFGDATSQAAAVGLGSSLGHGTMVLFQLVWLSFSVFNLTWVGIYLAIALSLKLVQVAASIWLFIKNLIPFIN